MCEWGDSVNLVVSIPARLAHDGKERLDDKPIDRCIAPIVKALNDAGIKTDASCCGHGKQRGSIVLRDGRELLIRRWDDG